MVEQVDRARDVEALEQLRDLGSDARQRLHLGKKRIENVRAHS